MDESQKRAPHSWDNKTLRPNLDFRRLIDQCVAISQTIQSILNKLSISFNSFRTNCSFLSWNNPIQPFWPLWSSISSNNQFIHFLEPSNHLWISHWNHLIHFLSNSFTFRAIQSSLLNKTLIQSIHSVLRQSS